MVQEQYWVGNTYRTQCRSDVCIEETGRERGLDRESHLQVLSPVWMAHAHRNAKVPVSYQPHSLTALPQQRMTPTPKSN